jgi:hypothetical protein
MNKDIKGFKSLFSDGRKYSESKYKYIDDYKKEHYSMFSAQLKKEEYDEIKELLRSRGMSNAELVRFAVEKLRSM